MNKKPFLLVLHDALKLDVIPLLEMPLRISNLLFACDPDPTAEIFNSVALVNSVSLENMSSYFFCLLRVFREEIIVPLLPLLYLFSTGTLCFDVVHYILHRCNKSSFPFIKWLARIHHFHHLYYTPRLKFDEKYLRLNAFKALPLELGFQIFGSLLGYSFALLMIKNGSIWLTRRHLWIVFCFQILRTIFVILISGRDSNHIVYKTVPKDNNWFFVGPEFHSLHHLYPDRYMGSFIKIFDWIGGTSYSVRSKRFVITGGSGSFGRAIIKVLEREGVRCIRKLKFGTDWSHNSFENALPVLSDSDVLILAHGTKGLDAMESNCHAAVQMIHLFKLHRKMDLKCQTLPEVWYVGSESELHPPWGNVSLQRYSRSKRYFLPHARAFYDDPDIIYRHIVPSAFRSRMGSAILSADWAAESTMWWIRRGARYVPVTYTGIAYLNFFKFIFWVPPARDLKQE